MKKPGWSVYPNLEKWINENCESVSEFAWLVAVSPTTIYKFLKGKSDLRYVVNDMLPEQQVSGIGRGAYH